MHLIIPCSWRPICKQSQTVSTPSPHILLSVQSTKALLKPMQTMPYCTQTSSLNRDQELVLLKGTCGKHTHPRRPCRLCILIISKPCVHCPTPRLQTHVAVGSTQTFAHVHFLLPKRNIIVFLSISTLPQKPNKHATVCSCATTPTSTYQNMQ